MIAGQAMHLRGRSMQLASMTRWTAPLAAIFIGSCDPVASGDEAKRQDAGAHSSAGDGEVASKAGSEAKGAGGGGTAGTGAGASNAGSSGARAGGAGAGASA